MSSKAKTNIRVDRGMVFWLDPVKSYNTKNYYCDRNGNTVPTHIQFGRRPYLVVSSKQNNWHSPTCNVIPLTTQRRSELGNVHVCFDFNGREHTALVEQIRTVDIDSLDEYMGTISDEIMMKIESAITIQLELRPMIRYKDVKLDSIVKNLEHIVDSIIQEKAELLRISRETVSAAQIDEAALRLGVTLESLFTSREIPDNAMQSSTNTALAEGFSGFKNEHSVSSEKHEEADNQHIKEGRKESVCSTMNGRQKYEGLTPIQKFNAKYGKVVDQNNKSEQDAITPVRKRGSAWTDETRRAFLQDCKSLSLEQIMQKWQLGSKRSVGQTRYACEKYFKQKEGV